MRHRDTERQTHIKIPKHIYTEINTGLPITRDAQIQRHTDIQNYARISSLKRVKLRDKQTHKSICSNSETSKPATETPIQAQRPKGHTDTWTHTEIRLSSLDEQTHTKSALCRHSLLPTSLSLSFFVTTLILMSTSLSLPKLGKRLPEDEAKFL